ncbi:MAG: hypothetical protein ACRDHZ_11355 [Ktedonobacteraceae bacterium]
MKKVEIEIKTILNQLPDNGAAAVLGGVEANPSVLAAVYSAWLPNENGNFREAVKAVLDVFSDHVWQWPWFDVCLKAFSEHDVWPDDVLGWDSFEPVPPEPKPETPEDSLEWLDLKDVRAILKAEGIKLGRTRRIDAYNALYHQVPFEKWRHVAISNWDADTKAGPDLEGQIYAKISLLVLTLSIADFTRYRAVQISDLINGGPRMARAQVELNDKAAWLMFREASRKAPLPGIPPFYPGDRSDLHVDYGKWK